VYAATGGQKKTAEWLIEQGVLAHMHSEMPLQEKQQKHLDILKGAASSNCKETLKLFTDLFMTWGGPYFIPSAAFETLPAAIIHESTNSLDHIYNDLEFPKDWELTYNGHRMGTGMQVAANHGSFKSVQWLLGNGSDPQETTPSNPTKVLELAAENPSADQFRHLLETIETPDFQNQEDHQTLLHLASTNGNLHHVALLINEGCDVNIRDRYGLTALERAIVERRADIARVLMLCGADDSSIRKAKGMLNEIVDTDLEKTLDLYKETVKMFEEFEAVFESNRSFSRGGPLHMAVKLGCKLSTLLLSKTPLLNEQDSRGSTPLHWAVLENNLALVRILINSGANLDIKNHREKTPLDLANEISDRKMVRFLDSLPSRQEEAPLQEAEA
jgi:ankyrin repeat protein